MIYINSEQADNISQFSNRFQAILSMIPGGMNWLRWAMSDAGMPPCQVNSENELLCLIQDGLHADDAIRFYTFRADIHKILSLSDADVQQLSVVRNTNLDTQTNLATLLSSNGMYSYSDIAAVSSFLTSENANSNDLFQSPSFSDLLALVPFVQQFNNVESALQTPALAFAQANAATVPEFIYLVQFYVYVAQQQLAATLAPAAQSNEVQTWYNQFSPTVNYLLFTPTIGPGKSEAELRAGLPTLAGASRFLGYDTVPAAALNLVQNINLTGQYTAGQAGQYLAAIKNLVATTPPQPGTVSQDGRLTTFTIENDQAMALVGVDAAGNVFLLPGTTLKQQTT